MIKIFKLGALFCSLLFVAGCAGDKIENLVTFHVASSANITTAQSREQIKMPSTNFSLISNVEPFMYNNDLVRVDVAKVKLPEGAFLDGFYFTANTRGMKRLFTATATNLNNFIVAKINGTPFALRQVDMVITDGKLFMVADVPEGMDLQKTAEDINKSIEVSHKINE